MTGINGSTDQYWLPRNFLDNWRMEQIFQIATNMMELERFRVDRSRILFHRRSTSRKPAGIH
jgi:hypothetical protein